MCLCECLHMCMTGARGGQNWVLEEEEPKLHVVVSHHMSDGAKSRSSVRVSSLNCSAMSPTPITYNF